MAPAAGVHILIDDAAPLRVGVIIPARDEQATVGRVASELLVALTRTGAVTAAVVVCDNGSTDNTAAVALAAGAAVVVEPIPGYGRACLRAIEALPEVDVVLFIDADGQFETAAALSLVAAIRRGADMVIGSRALGAQERGALSLPQRLGNWLATRMIRLLWRHRFTDLGPFRAVRFGALKNMQMSSLTFGWTVEMQVKAVQAGLRCVDVPVSTYRRVGRSKISGTVRGVVAAGVGIIGTILVLWWREQFGQTIKVPQGLRASAS